ncbi:nuclear transport factor 2 family protein [Hufsiella ginkgonis]|uniref:DUF4878 domain-containing protein n=1 Tax=Hufsiella ginkgonis TaxID=2695274 RepID=A0A7K1Y4R5_9SPHI|nr:nuclear transport factor 2 family protein [Hufsiella ginkgonis]MXV17706.1 hypothetical protein [Hufsiella ginkgonis]
MKTLKITFLVACAMFTALFTQAGTIKTANDKLSMDYAIVAYVDAFSHGKNENLASVLDKDAKMTVQRGKSILTYNKANILQIAKYTEGTEQNCKTSYSVIENLPGQVIVKVNLDYEKFSQVNYVTMLQTDKGWKITNVSSVYN